MAKKLSFGLGAVLLIGMLTMGFLNRSTLSGTGGEIPLWLCIPFAGLLLCIALCPLLCSAWWESHQPWAVAFWSLLFLIPYALMGGLGTAVETALECIIGDYLTFIVLLFGLFCVAGNISLEGDLAGSPRINVFLLLLGTVLSSWIGTTGASMLMVRPVIKMNAWRRHRSHIMVFFIFLISNMGGCLTPIGDSPPSDGLFPGCPLLLEPAAGSGAAVQCGHPAGRLLLDRHAGYRKDIAAGNMPDIRKPGTEIHIRGLHNLVFLVMIVAAVVISGVLPTLPMFQNEAGEVIGIHIFGEVTLTVPRILEIAIILLAAFLSFKTTHVSVRKSNHFTWGAIQEVAILFVGIFITMQPALMLLTAKGGELGLTHPAEMFWATGALSSFLDNTPTYLVFLTAACAQGAQTGLTTTLGVVPTQMLAAISCGAVFMGANTYIGNAPNFMVKSISDENGIRMPSFFGYMFWSVRFLIPVFILDMLIFFW